VEGSALLLDAWFSGPEGPQALFADRILPFDDRAALVWARLMAEAKAAGRPQGNRICFCP